MKICQFFNWNISMMTFWDFLEQFMSLGVVLEDDLVLLDDDIHGKEFGGYISPEPEEAQVLKFTNHKGEEEERIITKRTSEEQKLDNKYQDIQKICLKRLPDKQIFRLIKDVQNRCIDLAQQILKRFITDTRTQREIAYLIITIARGENGFYDFDRGKLRRLYKVEIRDEKEFERCISEVPQVCFDMSQNLKFDPVWRKYTKEGKLISDFGKKSKRPKYKTNVEIEVQKSMVERKVVRDIGKIKEAKKIERSRSVSQEIQKKTSNHDTRAVKRVVEDVVEKLQRTEREYSKREEETGGLELQSSKILSLEISYHKEINKKGPNVIEKIKEPNSKEKSSDLNSSQNRNNQNFNSIFAFGKNSQTQQIDLESLKSEENRQDEVVNPYKFNSISSSFKSSALENQLNNVNKKSSTLNGYEFSSANYNKKKKKSIKPRIVENLKKIDFREKIEENEGNKKHVPALDLGLVDLKEDDMSSLGYHPSKNGNLTIDTGKKFNSRKETEKNFEVKLPTFEEDAEELKTDDKDGFQFHNFKVESQIDFRKKEILKKSQKKEETKQNEQLFKKKESLKHFDNYLKKYTIENEDSKRKLNPFEYRRRYKDSHTREYSQKKEIKTISRSNSRKIHHYPKSSKRKEINGHKRINNKRKNYQIMNRNHSEHTITYKRDHEEDKSFSQRDMIHPILRKNASYQKFRNRPKISVNSIMSHNKGDTSQRNSYLSRGYSNASKPRNDPSRERRRVVPNFGYVRPKLSRNRNPSQASINIKKDLSRERSRGYDQGAFYNKESSRNLSYTGNSYQNHNENDAYHLKYAISRLKKDANKRMQNSRNLGNYEQYPQNNLNFDPEGQAEVNYIYNQPSPGYQNERKFQQQQYTYPEHNQYNQADPRLLGNIGRNKSSQRVLNLRDNSREISLRRQNRGMVKARSFMLKPHQNQQINQAQQPSRYQRIKKSSSSNSFAVQNRYRDYRNGLQVMDPATTRTGFNNSEYENSGKKNSNGYEMNDVRKFSIDLNQNFRGFRGNNLSEKKEYAPPNFLKYANFGRDGADVNYFGN